MRGRALCTRIWRLAALGASPYKGGVMSYARPMLDSYPLTVNADASVLAAAIDAISDCAQACTADTDADLSEQNLAEMVKCIRLCLDCTDICTATGPLLEACVAICKTCGDECARHAHYEHCRVCEQACRRCERACRELLAALK